MRSAVVGVLLVALAAARARAGDDPSDIEVPAPESTPVEAASELPPPTEAPPTEAPQLPAEPAHADDPLVPCRVLLLDDRLDDAEQCLRAALDAPDASAALVARARALLDVVGAWKKRVALAAPQEAPAPTASAPVAVAEVPHEQLSMTTMVRDGTGEAVVHGALAGGTSAFLISAAIASATRASEADTIGWLVAAPPAGALLGATGSYAAVRLLQPDRGDLRLATSTMWMGMVQGFTLQLAVFDQSPDVGAIPLRFLTMLSGGAIGLGAGAVLGPLVDIEDGDVAVAHSAAFWGGVLSTTVLLGVTNAGVTMSGPVMVAIFAGGIGVPYLAVLVAHELLTIERWPSYLIDGGAAAGMLISGAVMAAFSVSAGSSAVGASVLMTTGLLAGLTVGTIAATMTSDAVRAEARVFENDRRLDEGAE